MRQRERRDVNASHGGQDAFTGWRRVYAYLQRAGARDSIKREARRKERHQMRQRDEKEKG